MARILILAIALLAGCANAPSLQPAPPAGVNLAGHWRLNVADSDDPLRIPQAISTGGVGGGGGPGRGGRGSRGGGQGAEPPGVQSIPVPMTVVADLLRWPGAEISVRQEGGIATFISEGDTRVFQPVAGMQPTASGHAARRGRRDASAAEVGWSGPVLVVRVEPDEDQPGYESRYRLSENGDRLLQAITLLGGRLSGFTLSRVWDRE
jgi:hypothetical protein